MAKRLAAGEVDRNARVVLQMLGKPGTRLIEAEAGQWKIDSDGRRRMAQTVEDTVVRELVERNWLIREPSGSYRISMAGERLMAGPGARPSARCADQHKLLRPPDPGLRGGPRGPVVNEAESPLSWLKSRRDKSGEPLISNAQYDAGERLRRDFTFAQLSPRLTMSWNNSVPSGSRGRSGPRPDSLEVNERAVAAKQRFMRALDAVGPELSDILVEVCCLWRGLEAAERSLGWPQRSGKLVLQIALTRLASHYGLISAVTRSHGPAVIRHWGSEGYRPQVNFGSGDGDQA